MSTSSSFSSTESSTGKSLESDCTYPDFLHVFNLHFSVLVCVFLFFFKCKYNGIEQGLTADQNGKNLTAHDGCSLNSWGKGGGWTGLIVPVTFVYK